MLKNLDTFGISYEPYITKNRKQCKSIFSGFLTIGIYMLTFVYFCYLMNQWRLNDIQPKVSETSELMQDQFDFYYDDSPITIELFGFRLYDTLVTTFKNNQGEVFVYEELENISCQSFIGDNPGRACFNIQQIDRSIFRQSSYNKIIMYLNKCNFTKCIQIDIHDIFIDNNCITDEQLQKALEMDQVWFQITQWTQQYDYINDIIVTIPQIQYLPFKTQYTQYIAYDSNIAEVSVDSGILLENIKNVRIMRDSYNYQAEFNINNTWYNFKDTECYLYIQIGLNNQLSKIRVQNIKISEIMAQVSSIYNILMLIRFIGIFYNKEKLFHKTSLKLLKIQSTQNIFIQNTFQKISNLFKKQVRSKQDQQNEKRQIEFLINQQNIFHQFKVIQQIQQKLDLYPNKLTNDEYTTQKILPQIRNKDNYSEAFKVQSFTPYVASSIREVHQDINLQISPSIRLET